MKHITIFLVGIIISSSIFAQQSYEAKADSIIGLMTLDEKIGQLNQITGFQMATGPITNSTSFRIRHHSWLPDRIPYSFGYGLQF